MSKIFGIYYGIYLQNIWLLFLSMAIYCDLSNDIPTLSKTTVYNTLKLFVENGITSTLTIEENEVRYDAIMTEHAHFKCDGCGTIYDIEIGNIEFSQIGLK